MSKRIYILAVGFGLSCAAALAANAASLHLPVPAGSAVTRVGTSDGAGLPGLPGGRGGEPGNAAGRAPVAKYDIDGLYKYCVDQMDAVKRGDPSPDSDEAFMPSDCVDFFVVPSESGTAERAGKPGESEYDDALFSYCVDLLRQARRDDGLPGYKGKRRVYSNDFAPRDCSAYFDSLDKAGKGEGRYSLKRNGRRGASLSGGIGGEGGRAGRGQGGGSGGAGGAGVLGGLGGRGGAGGSSD